MEIDRTIFGDAQELSSHLVGWSEVMAQMDHGIISMDLPSLPAVHAVPQVCPRT